MKKFLNTRYIFIALVTSLIFLLACSNELELQQGSSEQLYVHFLDVGQGDSTVIQFPNGEVALIDGGSRSEKDFLVNHIKSLDIEKIDYLIATHPHEDHIGGLPEVIKTFDIGKIYMPKKSANTRIFETLIDEIKNKGLKVTEAKGGMDILKTQDLSFTILAPNSDNYSNINDYSIANKLEYKDVSIIFTGDAEKTLESEMISLGYDLSADVLKVGHHGSNSSSTMEFLKSVSPKYGIISSGEGNRYGHPHKEVIERLRQNNIEILRTNELGNIYMGSDGKKIVFSSDKRDFIKENVLDVKNDKEETSNDNDISNNTIENKVYIGNINSKVYHHKSCSSLPNPENRIFFESIEEAENKGYRKHSRCVK